MHRPKLREKPPQQGQNKNKLGKNAFTIHISNPIPETIFHLIGSYQKLGKTRKRALANTVGWRVSWYSTHGKQFDIVYEHSRHTSPCPASPSTRTHRKAPAAVLAAVLLSQPK